MRIISPIELGFCGLLIIISTSTLTCTAAKAAELPLTSTSHTAATVRPVPNAETNAFSYRTMTDITALRRLLDAGLDPNARSPDVNRELLLWRAVRFKALGSAKLLLDCGARVDEPSAGFRKTALFQAVYDGSFEIATLLLDRGADPNAADLYGNNPLREAIIAKRPEMLRLLLNHGSNPNQRNKEAQTMTNIATESGTPIIQAILAHKDEAARFLPDQLVGRWQSVDTKHNLTTTLLFAKDGTYTGTVQQNGKSGGSFSGQWALEKGLLLYEYTSSADKHIPAGSKDQDVLMDLAPDHYTIVNTLGIPETYIRLE